MAGPQVVGAKVVLHHCLPGNAQQGEEEGRGKAGAVLAGGAVEHQRPVLAVAQGREQGAEARRAAARIVAIMVREELHHDVRIGRPVGHRAADLVADAGLDVGADDATGQAVDQMRSLSGFVDAPQVDDGAHAKLAQRAAVLVGQAAEMGGAEDGVAADGAAVGGLVAAEVAEVGAALQVKDVGENGVGHGRVSSTPCRRRSCRLRVRIFAPASRRRRDAFRTAVRPRRRPRRCATDRCRRSR